MCSKVSRVFLPTEKMAGQNISLLSITKILSSLRTETEESYVMYSVFLAVEKTATHNISILTVTKIS